MLYNLGAVGVEVDVYRGAVEGPPSELVGKESGSDSRSSSLTLRVVLNVSSRR